MLAARSARLSSGLARLSSRRVALPSSRRHFIQGLCDGFLDLSLALPLPPSFPPYSTTIILVTTLSRLAFLPIAIWGRRRQWRFEELVLPELKKMKPLVAESVLTQMRREGIRGTKDSIKAEFAKRSTQLLTTRQKELITQYRCRPWPTVLVPALSQIPVFVLMSVVFARLSVLPTPFDSESFLTLTTLAHPDPTMALPIFLGVVTMANVESRHWVMSAAELEHERIVQEAKEKRRAETGQTVIEPRQHIKTGFRLLSVGRIIFAAIMPGSIVLYWVTSATLGLFQTWIFDWVDIRRKRARELLPVKSPVLSSNHTASLETAPSVRPKAKKNRR